MICLIVFVQTYIHTALCLVHYILLFIKLLHFFESDNIWKNRCASCRLDVTDAMKQGYVMLANTASVDSWSVCG